MLMGNVDCKHKEQTSVKQCSDETSPFGTHAVYSGGGYTQVATASQKTHGKGGGIH